MALPEQKKQLSYGTIAKPRPRQGHISGLLKNIIASLVLMFMLMKLRLILRPEIIIGLIGAIAITMSLFFSIGVVVANPNLFAN